MKIPNNLLDAIKNKIIDLIKLKQSPFFAAIVTSAGAFEGISLIADNFGWEGSKERFIIIGLLSLLLGSCSVVIILLQREKLVYQNYLLASNEQSDRDSELQKRRVIGVLAPISSWSTTFYIDIIRGVQETANREMEQYQMRMVIIDVPREEGIESTDDLIIRMLSQIDALMVINIRLSDKVCAQLLQKNIPVVNLHHSQKGRGIGRPFIASLIPDHLAFVQLMEHLFDEMQCRTAVLITKTLKNPFKHARTDPFRNEKRQIFIKSIKKNQMKFNKEIMLKDFDGELRPGEAYILEVDKYTYSYGELLFDKVKNSNQRNVAFVFLADDVAAGFMDACTKDGRTAKQRGYRVSGFDNTAISKLLNMTSIDYSLTSLGYSAYSKVENELVHPGTTHYSEEKIGTVLFIRESTSW